MLIKTSLHDSQVMYWEPPSTWRACGRSTPMATLAAQDRHDGRPRGPSGRYDALRDLAFDYAFVLDQLERRS